jgi:aryl-alcohol dehydrogenase-like predicted oxidoreductase
VVGRLEPIAARRGVSLATLSLAWLLAQGDEVIPLVGSSRADNVERNLAALDLELSPDDLAAIAEAAPAGAAAGDRYPASHMPSLGR